MRNVRADRVRNSSTVTGVLFNRSLLGFAPLAVQHVAASVWLPPMKPMSGTVLPARPLSGCGVIGRFLVLNNPRADLTVATNWHCDEVSSNDIETCGL